MKERYIRQVKRTLNLPRKAKYEVIRDLNEAFESAQEHGETEQQIIERLGTPREFADGIHEQIGITRTDNSELKRRIGIIATALMATIAFAMAFYIHALSPAKGVIGQADAMTDIQIVGSGIDAFRLMIVLGGVALIAAICLALGHVHKGIGRKST